MAIINFVSLFSSTPPALCSISRLSLKIWFHCLVRNNIISFNNSIITTIVINNDSKQHSFVSVTSPSLPQLPVRCQGGHQSKRTVRETDQLVRQRDGLQPPPSGVDRTHALGRQLALYNTWGQIRIGARGRTHVKAVVWLLSWPCGFMHHTWFA